MDDKPETEQNISNGNWNANRGILDTQLDTLGQIGGKFQYQILENADEMLCALQKELPPERYKEVAAIVEMMLKQPLRRTIGRIRCVARSLEEIKRHME